MSNLIVSSAGDHVRHYTFEDTGIRIGSYEELCYYICANPVLFVEDWCTFSLMNWLSRELRLEEVVRKMNGYSKDSYLQIGVLLDYGDYVEKEQAAVVIEAIRGMQSGSRVQLLKQRGDLYLRCGKFFRARQEYLQLLRQERLIPDKVFLGNIYHNLGVTYLMDRDIPEGKRCFLTAFSNNKSKDSCVPYLLLIYLEGGEPAVRTEGLKLGLAPDYADGVIRMIRDRLESIGETGEEQIFEKIRLRREQGEYDTAKKKLDHLLDQWKEQYRTQTG